MDTHAETHCHTYSLTQTHTHTHTHTHTWRHTHTHTHTHTNTHTQTVSNRWTAKTLLHTVNLCSWFEAKCVSFCPPKLVDKECSQWDMYGNIPVLSVCVQVCIMNIIQSKMNKYISICIASQNVCCSDPNFFFNRVIYIFIIFKISSNLAIYGILLRLLK